VGAEISRSRPAESGMDTTPTTITLSDLSHVSWLLAHDLRFISARIEGPRAVFTLEDDGRADVLIGQFERNEIFGRFTSARRHCVRVIERMRGSHRPMEAQEFAALRDNPNRAAASRLAVSRDRENFRYAKFARGREELPTGWLGAFAGLVVGGEPRRRIVAKVRVPLGVNGKPDGHLPPGRLLPLVSRRVLAEVFAVNALTITRWMTEVPPLPVKVPGGPGRSALYSLSDTTKWYLARMTAQPLANGNGRAHRDQAYAEQARMNTVRIALSIATMKSELMDARLIRAAWAEARAYFRARTLALPGAIAPEVARTATRGPGAVEAALMDAVRDLLTTLSTWEPKPAGGADPDD